MKGQFQKTVMAIMAAVTLLGGVTVMAASDAVTKTVEVTFNNFKTYLFEREFTMKDEQGNELEPFMYNGTVYVPVKSVLYAMGENARWENDALYFGKNPEPEPQPVQGAYLGTDVVAYDLKGGWNSLPKEYPAAGSFSLGGVSYTKGITYHYSIYDGNAVYLLSGKYKYFSGIYGMPDYSTNSMQADCTLKIYGDDKLLAGLTMVSGQLPQPFSVDITGVNQLRIEMPHYGYYALANAVFTQSPVSAAPTRPVLKDNAKIGTDMQAFIRSYIKEYPADGSFRINDVAYSNGITGSSSSSTAFYNVDGQYAKMSGVYGSVGNSGEDGRRKIKIYGDGRLLTELSTAPGAARPFSVDIKGVKVIKIEIDYNYSYRAPALADVIFQK